jgi:hypothetical protein
LLWACSTMKIFELEIIPEIVFKMWKSSPRGRQGCIGEGGIRGYTACTYHLLLTVSYTLPSSKKSDAFWVSLAKLTSVRIYTHPSFVAIQHWRLVKLEILLKILLVFERSCMFAVNGEIVSTDCSLRLWGLHRSLRRMTSAFLAKMQVKRWRWNQGDASRYW